MHHPYSRRLPGHTIIELVALLAIAAVLATGATAGWTSAQDSLRLALGSSRSRAVLAEARLLALSRGESVRVEPRHGGRSLALLSGEVPAPRLQREVWLPPGLTVTSNRPAVSYYPWPRAASPVTLTLCGTRRARRLVVSQTGRVRVEDGGSCPRP